MKDDDETYRVGRGRPPLHTRFAPGKSGNPRGRPKGRKSMESIICELLDQQVFIGVGDKRRRVTRREAMMMQQVQSALKGDRKAVEFLLATQSSTDAGSGQELSAVTVADEAIIARFMTKRAGVRDDLP